MPMDESLKNKKTSSLKTPDQLLKYFNFWFQQLEDTMSIEKKRLTIANLQNLSIGVIGSLFVIILIILFIGKLGNLSLQDILTKKIFAPLSITNLGRDTSGYDDILIRKAGKQIAQKSAGVPKKGLDIGGGTGNLSQNEGSGQKEEITPRQPAGARSRQTGAVEYGVSGQPSGGETFGGISGGGGRPGGGGQLGGGGTITGSPGDGVTIIRVKSGSFLIPLVNIIVNLKVYQLLFIPFLVSIIISWHAMKVKRKAALASLKSKKEMLNAEKELGLMQIASTGSYKPFSYFPMPNLSITFDDWRTFNFAEVFVSFKVMLTFLGSISSIISVIIALTQK